jgi:hypothetical protein
VNSTPGKEIGQLSHTMKSMLKELERMKSLSEELEVANNSLTEASKSVMDSSDLIGSAGIGIADLTKEIVALDPKGLRKFIEDQNDSLVGELKNEMSVIDNKVKTLTILVGSSLVLSVGILAFLFFGK